VQELLSHETIKLRVPAGVREGQRLRVSGRGAAGGHGDLYVVVEIDVPAHINAEERAAWEKLARASRFSPQPPSRT